MIGLKKLKRVNILKNELVIQLQNDRFIIYSKNLKISKYVLYIY